MRNLNPRLLFQALYIRTRRLLSLFCKDQCGFGLVEVLMCIGLMALVAMGLSKMLTRGVQNSKAIFDREEIAMLRQNIENNLSCTASLNITPTVSLPRACASYSDVILRNGSGLPLNTGDWTVRGKCQNNELVITVVKPGKDPLTDKQWASMQSGVDLFNGLGKFCSEYFLNSQCTQVDYPIFLGFESNGPKCCRKVTSTAMNLATASCNLTEYAVSGGFSCNPSSTGFVWPTGTPAGVLGFMMGRRSFLEPDGRSWSAECQTNDSSVPLATQAVAVCCPL